MHPSLYFTLESIKCRRQSLSPRSAKGTLSPAYSEPHRMPDTTPGTGSQRARRAPTFPSSSRPTGEEEGWVDMQGPPAGSDQHRARQRKQSSKRRRSTLFQRKKNTPNTPLLFQLSRAFFWLPIHLSLHLLQPAAFPTTLLKITGDEMTTMLAPRLTGHSSVLTSAVHVLLPETAFPCHPWNSPQLFHRPFWLSGWPLFTPKGWCSLEHPGTSLLTRHTLRGAVSLASQLAPQAAALVPSSTAHPLFLLLQHLHRAVWNPSQPNMSKTTAWHQVHEMIQKQEHLQKIQHCMIPSHGVRSRTLRLYPLFCPALRK